MYTVFYSGWIFYLPFFCTFKATTIFHSYFCHFCLIILRVSLHLIHFNHFISNYHLKRRSKKWSLSWRHRWTPEGGAGVRLVLDWNHKIQWRGQKNCNSIYVEEIGINIVLLLCHFNSLQCLLCFRRFFHGGNDDEGGRRRDSTGMPRRRVRSRWRVTIRSLSTIHTHPSSSSDDENYKKQDESLLLYLLSNELSN